MHDGMQYDVIQGQGQEPLKDGKPAIFKSCHLRHLQWELATDCWPRAQYLNLIWPDFLYLS